jgi:preprotein translocase subunit SecE
VQNVGKLISLKMERIRLYIKESYNELVHNVSWPSWPNLQGNAIAVIVAIVILALIVFLMDVASKSSLDLIYGL